MEIITSLENLNTKKKTSVALGNFDGLHIGHRKVMKKALEEAASGGLASLCFTFSNHPFNFILGRDDGDPDAVKLICTEEEKIALIEEAGFDILVNVPFDENIMTMDAHDFFSGIVAGKLNAAFVSAGFNYTYGARATGRPETLEQECRDAGIGVSIHEPVTAEGKIVSSTLVREMIASGNMEMTEKLLGRPYSFTGTVKHGKRLARSMGIPTVNIPAPARQMLPPNGVYFSTIHIGGKTYKSVSNLGVNPTVDREGSQKTIETNIFDYEGVDGGAYGKDVTVCFYHFSRSERRFRDKDELFAQIARDCADAREFHRM